MAIDVVMPHMGESVVEGTVAKWLVKVGDQVRLDQPLLEISTDKIDTEIPSPESGVIAQILASEGQTVPVGTRLAIIDPNTGSAEAGRPQPSDGHDASASHAGADDADEPSAPDAAAPQAAPAAAPAAAAPAPPPVAAAPTPSPAAAPVGSAAAASAEASRRYSPVVIKMAEDYGIDLTQIKGTGLGGRVTKSDIMRYLEAQPAEPPPPQPGPMRTPATPAIQSRPEPPRPAATPSPAVAPPVAAASTPSSYHAPAYEPREGDIVEPFSRRRKLIAEHMVYSKTHAPHVGTVAECDVTKASALREKHRRAFSEREGFNLTFLPLIAAATVRALKEFPKMNSSVVGDSHVIRKQINLGIAMDTDEGLLVPVIKAAETMSIVGLAREMERLRRRVQEKKITADELSGGSFTISNPGREGNLFGLAIINQPQVGILRVGETKKRPVVIEHDGADVIAIRTMMYMALSYDHRVIDGLLANRFLYRCARVLEEADFELT